MNGIDITANSRWPFAASIIRYHLNRVDRNHDVTYENSWKQLE